MIKKPSLQEMTLSVAREYLGKKEASGKNDGAFVRLVQLFVAKGSAWLENQPWCVCFVTFCVHQAALILGEKTQLPREASSARLAKWFKERELLTDKPSERCIGLIKDPKKGFRHTFLVGGIQGDFVWGIDGNWQNAVTRTQHKIKDCMFGPII